MHHMISRIDQAKFHLFSFPIIIAKQKGGETWSYKWLYVFLQKIYSAHFI